MFSPELVRASAGSGKTFALTSRFLAICAAGESPEKILATTFTRKAAGEILNRIFVRLARACLDQKAAKELGCQIGVPNLSCKGAQSIFIRIIESQHKLQICTLDSFFSSIAKVFAFELRFPPDFTVSKDSSREVLSESISDYLACSNPEEIQTLLNGFHAGALKRSIHDQMLQTVSSLLGLYRASSTDAWMSEFSETLEVELDEIADQLSSISLPKTKAGKENSLWAKSRQQLLDAVKQQDWKTISDNGLIGKFVAGEDSFARVKIPDELKAILEPIKRAARILMRRMLSTRTGATKELISKIDRLLCNRERHERVIDFQRIKLVLSSAAQLHNLDELYYRLDSRISHVLLDEFQDTSIVEWRVLEPIVEEILSKSGSEHSFFVVGDVKQAIYGWRGGVSEIFDTLQSRWPQLEASDQDETRRLAPVLVDVVNRIFNGLEENPALKFAPLAARNWAAKFRPHQSLAESKGGYVGFYEFTEGEFGEAKSVYEALELRCHKIRENAPWATIGILVRRNESVGNIVEWLSRAGSELEVSEEGGTSLMRSQAVYTLLQMLRIIEHPSDTLASFVVKNSVLGRELKLDLLNQSQLLTEVGRYRWQIFNRGLRETLRHWVKLVEGYYPSQERSRMHHLLHMAAAFDQAPGHRIMDFVRLVQEEKREEPSASHIRVMTIHQAKGLEFDAVILPELSVPLSDLKQNLVLTSSKNPLEGPDRISSYPGKSARHIDSELQEIYETALNREVHESLSLLYVALTRARHALYIFSDISNQSKPLRSFGSVLKEALTDASFKGGDGLIFELGSENWMNGHVPVFDRTMVSTLTCGRVELRACNDVRKRGFARKSPSALEGGSKVDLELLFRSSSQNALKRGVALHRLCESLDWVEDDEIDFDHLDHALLELELTHSQATELKAEFISMLSYPEIRKIFLKSAYPNLEALYKEFPFAYRNENTIFQGALDRLVVYKDETHKLVAQVIDFKTDQFVDFSESSLEERVQYYIPQVESYREAVTRFLGLAKEQVRTAIVFLSIGRVVKLS